MNPLLVALDLPELDAAEDLARVLLPHVGGFKVGLELLMSEGPTAVSRIASLGLPVFADAKLHDIPNTAGAAARALSARGARWVTAHALGGRAMLEAVAEGLGEGAGLLAVTVLTSIGDDELETLEGSETVASQVRRLAGLALSAGAEGVICAVDEVGTVREVSNELLVVTPGIRTDVGERHDQRRVATPEEAMAAGADLIVVGRAVTGSPDPVASASRIVDLASRSRSV
ncbi:MAG: orotidine-5'-phosphate decarboxylase [Acidimicrobiia bacterium]